MPSTRELMAVTPMSPELVADIRYMADRKSDIHSQERQSQPLGTEVHTNELHELVSKALTLYGRPDTKSIVMSYIGFGKAPKEVEFTCDPVGIYGFNDSHRVEPAGPFGLRPITTDIRRGIIFPGGEDGFFAQLVQTTTQRQFLAKTVIESGEARATNGEVLLARFCARLALDQGQVLRTT